MPKKALLGRWGHNQGDPCSPRKFSKSGVPVIHTFIHYCTIKLKDGCTHNCISEAIPSTGNILSIGYNFSSEFLLLSKLLHYVLGTQKSSGTIGPILFIRNGSASENLNLSIS